MAAIPRESYEGRVRATGLGEDFLESAWQRPLRSEAEKRPPGEGRRPENQICARFRNRKQNAAIDLGLEEPISDSRSTDMTDD